MNGPNLDQVKKNAGDADEAARTNYLVGPKAARPSPMSCLGCRTSRR